MKKIAAHVVAIGLAACSIVAAEKATTEDSFARLKDPEPSVRAAAVAEVGRGTDPRAKAALKRALADPEHVVRLAAAKVLAATKDAAALDELVAGLDSDDVLTRDGSVLALSHRPDAKAFDALMAQCAKRSLAFRWRVGEAIAMAANHAFIPMMLDKVSQGADWRIQEVSVVALALMHDAVGIDPLLHSIRSNDPYIRRIACWQLGVIGDPRAIDPLISDMLEKYDNYNDRVWGAVAINRIGAGLDPPVAAVVGELAHAQEGKIEALKRNWAAARDRYIPDESP
ncbi:MAG: hypothetical protein CMJ18_22525 [Phycisphaeraceae bacterium]|nr:hypothetical protein [Phycisphaeraceae bacterium]